MLRGPELLIPAATTSIVCRGRVSLLQHFFHDQPALGVFNLIPIPPLDAAVFLAAFCPPALKMGMEQFQQFGFLILVVALYTGIVGRFGILYSYCCEFIFIGTGISFT